MEIERKWIVAGWPDDAGISLPLMCTEYQDQGYLHTDVPIVRIRREERGESVKYVLCFKSAGYLAREEIEIELRREDYDRLSAMIGQPLIKKTRRIYLLPDDLRLEVNLVDEGLPSQFMYAEVEYDSEKQALSWDPELIGLGDYLDNDVTHQSGQSMNAHWARTRSRGTDT